MDLRDELEAALGGLYSIEQELGGGGMSRVFLARETSLGRRVVVKVLPKELTGGVNVDRFRREIVLAAQRTKTRTARRIPISSRLRGVGNAAARPQW